MAEIPNNIVYLMAVDNAGNVVNIAVDSVLQTKTVIQTETPRSTGKKVSKTEDTATPAPQVINTETTVELKIDADQNYVPLVDSNKTNLINSVLYQSGKKIGLGKKNPAFAFDLYGGSFNVDTNKIIFNGYKIDKQNVAYIDNETDPLDITIVLGDDEEVKTVSANKLLLRGQILDIPLEKNRIVVVDDLGKVDAIEDIYLESINNLTYKAQEISIGLGLSVNDITLEDTDDSINKISKHTIQIPTASRTKRGALSSTDYIKFDDKQDAITLTPNRVVISDSLGKITQSSISTTILGYLSNVSSDIQAQINAKFTLPSFVAGSVIFSNGTTLVQDNANFYYDDANNRLVVSNIYSPIIGNPSGVSAQNDWTFGSNVTLATGITPTLDQHFVTKKYVDDVALTGLRLGAEVKTVSISNISLSGIQTINGYTTVAGDRVLVIGQTTASQNGVYVVSSGAWARATDSDTDAELRGYQYLINAGTEAGARYGNTNTTAITVGTTSVTYQKISGQETDPIFTASAASGITSTLISNWNTAYSRSLPDNSMAITGTGTKTITLTRQSGATISASFTESVQSVSGTTNRITVGTAPNYSIDISANYVGQASITTLGTISTGTWQGTAIANAYVAGAATWNAKQDAITGAATTITSANLTASKILASDTSGKVAITSAATLTELGYLSGVTSSIQTQLGTKQGTITLTTNGTSGAAQLSGNTLNIPIYQGGVSSFNSRTGAITPAEGDYSLTQLSDVAITTAATANYLRYNGTSWVNASITSSDITTALGFTPMQTESDTLQSVTTRGNTTTTFIQASYFKENSDVRFKRVLSENPDIDVSSIGVIKYMRTDFDTDTIRYGYSAQDVYDVIPDVVGRGHDGKLSVNYSDIHSLKILQLEKRVAELEAKLGING